MKRVFLIRHAQASWGKRNYDVLSETGIAQSTLLGNHLKPWDLNPKTIICGEHVRHKTTAKHCLKAMFIEPHWQEDARWNEFNFQNVIEQFKPLYRIHELMVADMARTLSPKKTFKEMFAQALNQWRAGTHDAQYIENWPAFQARALKALASIKHIEHEGDVIIFTSGGVIGTIVSHLLNIPDEQWASLVAGIINTSVTQLSVDSDEIKLVSFNEHSHFLGTHANLLSQH